MVGLGSPLVNQFGVSLIVVGVVNQPYDFEPRLRPMFPGAFKNLRLLVTDLYEVLCAAPIDCPNIDSQYAIPGRKPSKPRWLFL
jgi:hypothetical protein